MKTMRIIACFLSIMSLFTTSAYADTSSSPPSIVGNYQCQRTDASNNSVTYPVTVTQTGDTYTFEWVDKTTNNPQMYGTALIHPSLNNVIAASFWDITNPDTNGVALYEIQIDGTLQGNWIVQSTKNSGTETCIKNK